MEIYIQKISYYKYLSDNKADSYLSKLENFQRDNAAIIQWNFDKLFDTTFMAENLFEVLKTMNPKVKHLCLLQGYKIDRETFSKEFELSPELDSAIVSKDLFKKTRQYWHFLHFVLLFGHINVFDRIVKFFKPTLWEILSDMDVKSISHNAVDFYSMLTLTLMA